MQYSGFDIVGITTVFGNADLDHATRNALTVVELSGRQIPIVREGIAIGQTIMPAYDCQLEMAPWRGRPLVTTASDVDVKRFLRHSSQHDAELMLSMLLKLPIVRFVPLLLLGLVLTACGGSEATRQDIPQASGFDTSDRATAARHLGVRTFVIVPAESKASYVADEELFALAFTKFGLPAGWAKVVGSTQAIEGRFQIDMEQPAAWLGNNEFAVRMNTFSTGRDMRDNWIRENGPRFNDYPVATFRATGIEGAARPFAPAKRCPSISEERSRSERLPGRRRSPCAPCSQETR